jgi:outer membrane protein OmpA-like peptidoglycan-associated protein
MPALPRGAQVLEVSTAAGALISFRPRGTTVVELRGTERMPKASISLKVESRPGFVEIDINRGEIKNLEPAWRLGRDFLTYVLWVVSVDGAASNIGEITFEDDSPISINVTTTDQTFWMMVTAEPDFAVQDPSPAVVLVSQSQENTATGNKGIPIPGRHVYYTNYTDYHAGEPAALAADTSRELLQARKAVELASRSGILATPRSASSEPLPDEVRTREALELARSYLAQAETEFASSGRSDLTIQFARTAAQIAENARALALGAVGGIVVRQLNRELEKISRELVSTQDRLAQLEPALDQERRRTRELESQVLALEERIELLETQRGADERETARLRSERDALCGELRRQLASLGQLTERGGALVLTLASDILFDFNRYDLRPAARESLAKLAVLRLLLFPHAEVRYEGHTDLVGEEEYNQWLSEQRALAVYRYFLEDRLALASEENQKAELEQKLRNADQLLKMSYAASRRSSSAHQQLLASLANTVVGKGMREPLVPEKGPNEQNRRVTLTFPEPPVGELTSLCQN